jgi:hypothetical protein
MEVGIVLKDDHLQVLQIPVVLSIVPAENSDTESH